MKPVLLVYFPSNVMESFNNSSIILSYTPFAQSGPNIMGLNDVPCHFPNVIYCFLHHALFALFRVNDLYISLAFSLIIL